MAKKKNNDEAAAVEEARVSLSSDNATLLLAAVEELELDPSVVKVVDGFLVAPANVVEKAGAATVADEEGEPVQGTVADASDADAVAANESKEE
jgi:hypothetical protein